MAEDLTRLDTHFAFGDNWRSFADEIDEPRASKAVASLSRLLPASEVRGRTFIDMGCGSGLSSLAALRLGAASVLAIDIDPASVETARAVLSQLAPKERWQCAQYSILDLSPATLGQFDIVYSWGVLHHTGDMWRAVEKAASFVAPDGTLVVALYRKTPSCGMWKVLKRIYSRAPRWVQLPARTLYCATFLTATALHGTNPLSYIRNYSSDRGMSLWHDAHDWLGGYPYDSAAPNEVNRALGQLGFVVRREFLVPQTRGRFGSGCDEYVFARRP